MPTPQIAILVALEIEAIAVRGGLASEWPVRVVTVGPGAMRMPEAATLRRVTHVIVAGLGGGLDPSLASGDVVLDTALPDLSRRLQERGVARAGPVHTADRIVESPRAKRALFDRTGASVVDMEQAVVVGRLRASEAGPGRQAVIGIRAVLDPADRALPAAFTEMIDEAGRARAGRAVRVLLRRPGMIPAAIASMRQSRVATRRLRLGVAAAVEAIMRPEGPA